MTRDYRSRLVLIAAFAVAVLVTLGAVVTQRGDRASANEPPAKEPRARVGLDPVKSTCPTAEPDELPPDALAGATDAALAHFQRASKAPRASTPCPRTAV